MLSFGAILNGNVVIVMCVSTLHLKTWQILAFLKAQVYPCIAALPDNTRQADKLMDGTLICLLIKMIEGSGEDVYML